MRPRPLQSSPFGLLYFGATPSPSAFFAVDLRPRLAAVRTVVSYGLRVIRAASHPALPYNGEGKGGGAEAISRSPYQSSRQPRSFAGDGGPSRVPAGGAGSKGHNGACLLMTPKR